MPSGVARALLCLLGLVSGATAQARYFGKDLGPLSELHHKVKGRVFAVDSRTLYIQDFTYDGEGPAAYFYVGTSKQPGAAGSTRLRDDRGATTPLRKYRGEAVTLSLPEGVTLKDVRWFSVWCDDFSVNFGDVRIPRELEYPRPARVGALAGVHGVSSDHVVVVDAQTLLVPNFSYDGEAPDAKFWVGRGEKPTSQGIRIPDENGKEAPLRRYERKTIVLTLPGELTVFDIGHFAVWCEAFTVNFGHVTLPRQKLANVPPSLKMLGVSPQSKLNCEVLYDELAFEVRWAVAGDSIVLQLVAKLEDGEYMSFGVSGDSSHSQMVGGDVAVAWVDKTTLKGYAHDYYLDAKSQCAGVRGSCPDERLGEKTNSLRLLNAALVNGYSIVTYQRSLKAADELDRAIFTNLTQPIIWAIGPLNSKAEVSYHSHFLKTDKFIEFGRPPVWNCPMPESEEEHHQAHSQPAENKPVAGQGAGIGGEYSTAVIKPNPVPTPKPVEEGPAPWVIPPIQCNEPEDGVLYAQMGPTGGKQGYPAITGHVGWGISWYINGLLIPEINVVRGRKYTIVTEGGTDPEVPARYHPFYITNDPVGGYYHKTDEEKKGVVIYAGVRRSRTGELIPTGVGRLCNWTPDETGRSPDDYPSFGAYQRALTLVCEAGNPGVVTWVPDKDTPDTVYYQCFTHRYLGWKINVLNECDVTEGEASSVVERVAKPDDDLLQGEESIQVPTQLSPENNHIVDQRKKYQKIINTKHNDFSNTVTPPAGLSQYASDKHTDQPLSTAQITEVIQAAENLENRMRDEFIKDIKITASSYKDMKDPFLPEQPIAEDEEYIVELGKIPSNYMLPPNQKPLTLQSVLRPTPNGKPMGPMRTPYRRPAPPEIKRRPPQHKGNGYPLSMPNPHGHHGPQKSHQHGPHQGGLNVGPFQLGPNQGAHQNGPHPGNLHQNGPNQGNVHQNGPNPGNLYQNGPNQNNVHQGGPNHGPGLPGGHHAGSMPPNMKKHNKHPQNGRIPPNMNRQPVPPMKPPQHGPNPAHNNSPPKQINKMPNGPAPTIIIGQPTHNGPIHSQTLSLGKTDFIANQVVKSQITLPGLNDPAVQQSSLQNYLTKPVGQIILGKPMEHPVPLDQQMIPTKLHPVRHATPPTVQRQSTTLRQRVDSEIPIHPDVQSSDFIGETPDVSTLSTAVNTGFKPNSIVIESGFKPIIREPLMASEDRIADLDYPVPNRREDTDVEEEFDISPQVITHHEYPPSDQLTQNFEPMFIPSPEDHMLPNTYMETTKEVFPKNHAKEDRPHPVYVKKEDELNGLFSKKNMEKPVPSDMDMESNRVSSQYLPPDPKLPKEQSQKVKQEETFTTYDGKTVSAVSLTALPGAPESEKVPTKQFSSKLTSTDDLLKTPQFGPYKGDVPPQLTGLIQNDKPTALSSEPSDAKSTLLKLLNAFTGFDADEAEELKAEGSENRPVKTDEDKQEEDQQDEEEYDSEDVVVYEDEDYEKDDHDKKKDNQQKSDNKAEIDEENETHHHAHYEMENIKKHEEERENLDREEQETVERSRRETKDTQFEASDVSDETQPKHNSSTKNQVEFELPSSTTTNYNYSLSTVLLLLCLKFL